MLLPLSGLKEKEEQKRKCEGEWHTSCSAPLFLFKSKEGEEKEGSRSGGRSTLSLFTSALVGLLEGLALSLGFGFKVTFL